MNYQEDMRTECVMSEQQMGDDLMVLSAFYDSIGVENDVLPATELLPFPTLTAVLTDDTGFSRVISHSWLSMPQSAAQWSKYLQFYSELFLPDMERSILLEGLSVINEQLPLGHCFLVKPENTPEVVGLRWVQSYPLEEPPDQGCFADNVILFDYCCQLTQDFLNSLARGKTAAQALDALQ